MNILTIENLIKFTLQHMNEVVLDCSGQAQRLIGCAADEEDYYYIFKDKKGFRYVSCVGQLILLKYKIDEESYQYMNDFLCQNNVEEHEKHIFKDYRKTD